MNDTRVDEVWQAVRKQIEAQGVDLGGLTCEGAASPQVKVVCVDASMRNSLDAIGLVPRDQVVMVRVDSETVQKLDAWVESGAVKSRSEAAALFIREGLRLREAELDELAGAIEKVDAAKDSLRRKARKVLGVDARPEEPLAAEKGDAR